MTPQEEIDKLIASLPVEEQLRMLELVDTVLERRSVTAMQESFLQFIAYIQPDYLFGAHLKRLGGLLMDIEKGIKDRILVSVAPRHGKSQMISIYYPAWYLGRNPTHKVIIASHTADLAVDMSRKVRNLMQSDAYRKVFPSVEIAPDAKAAGKWNTNQGGEFFAVGVGGALAGRGAHLLLVDDPFNEQDIINGNHEVFDKVYEWYTYGARTRLMPGGRVCVLHTRWSKKDLIARLVKDAAMNDKSDQYEVFEFPAILYEGTDKEKPLFPEMWSLEALQRTKASMPLFQWNAQYMQSPTSADAAVIPKEWFKVWEKESPPPVDFVVMSLDAAVKSGDRNDFNALTTWGVWHNEETNRPEIILLNSINRRMEFPELKDLVLEEYREWEPDSLIIEDTANGAPLIQEFRAMGIPLQSYRPHRGSGDKRMRLSSVADMIRDGMVWVPQTRWAEELVEQVNDFPSVDHDDLCDATYLALRRLRSGGFVRLSTDEKEEPDWLPPKRAAYY